MAALDQPARDAGVTLMNEIGLDPGVDHMLAMACIDDAHSRGGKVREALASYPGAPRNETALHQPHTWSTQE